MQTISTPKQRITSDPAVQAALAVAVAAQGKYQALCSELEPVLDPRANNFALENALHAQTNTDGITRFASRMKDCSADAVELARRRAESVVADELHRFKATLPPILTAAEAVLHDLRTEAFEAEQNFFAGWGLGREKTGVSARLDGVEADLRHFRDGIKLHGEQLVNIPPNAFSNIINYFKRTEKAEPKPSLFSRMASLVTA